MTPDQIAAQAKMDIGIAAGIALKEIELSFHRYMYDMQHKVRAAITVENASLNALEVEALSPAEYVVLSNCKIQGPFTFTAHQCVITGCYVEVRYES